MDDFASAQKSRLLNARISQVTIAADSSSLHFGIIQLEVLVPNSDFSEARNVPMGSGSCRLESSVQIVGIFKPCQIGTVSARLRLRCINGLKAEMQVAWKMLGGCLQSLCAREY